MSKIKERLANRVFEIKSANTPEDLSFVIWSKGTEEATGSSKQSYRDGFVDWIKSYANGTGAKWQYKNPTELAESIWQPFLDEPNDIWFPAIRAALVNWIEDFKADLCSFCRLNKRENESYLCQNCIDDYNRERSVKADA
jgi:hypothetical protein